MTPLIPVDQALRHLLAAMPAITEQESVSLLEASAGRIVAEDIVAAVSVPAWDNSAMDGFAVRVETLCAGDELPVSQRIVAGSVGEPLLPGTAARIFTGAPVPPGADAVVMQENCDELVDRVRVRQLPARGENIRGAGDDIQAGAQLLASGSRPGPAEVALLASCGISRLAVTRKLRVALMTTGDELQAPGAALGPGKIYNSNHFLLAALIQRLPCELLDLGIVRDNRAATQAALLRAADSADCIISTGGVSVGAEDHVRDAVQAVGQLKLWRLALKPGKPFAFGQVGTAPFFGLPGNPVSAFVTFVLLVRPCLLRMAGAANVAPTELMLPAGFERKDVSDRQEYLRVMIQKTEGGVCQLVPCPNQSSGVISSLRQGDGLAIVEPGRRVRDGELLRFISFDAIV